MTIRTRDAQAALAAAIATRIGEPRYKLWFEGHTRFRARRRRAGRRRAQPPLRGVAQPHLPRRRRGRGRRGVRRAAGGAVPHRPRTVPGRPPRAGNAAGRAGAAPAAPAVVRASGSARAGGARTRRWRRLADFVVGPCNRVAHAAALSVVESPGEAANPLVLYGPVGTGKTHLLEGIWSGVRTAHPDWKVTYITSEDFTNRFVQSMRFDKQAGFRRQFREADVLLIDDIHFLATKKATREEFLHTLDALLSRRPAGRVDMRLSPAPGRRLRPRTGRSAAGRGGLEPGAARRRHAAGHPPRQVAAPARRPSPTRCWPSSPASCAATSASWRARSTPCATSAG